MSNEELVRKSGMQFLSKIVITWSQKIDYTRYRSDGAKRYAPHIHGGPKKRATDS